MKTENIIVANMKCNGCANTVKTGLLKLKGIKNVEVDIEKGSISVSCEDIERSVIINKLLSLGYPEAADDNGLLTKLKSYSSCAVGKINNL